MNNFQKLLKNICSCRDCRDLFGFEPNPVFGGSKNAKIIQISQAPSHNVHQTNKSFNDASGRKLREEWYKISDDDFYDQSNFFIAGIANCYPGKNHTGGDKAPPKRCADKWVNKIINSVNNELFILIGRHSAKYFFPKENFKDLVFSNQKINDKLAIILPHPSPLNQKWFKDNPEFEAKRLPEVQNIVHKALYKNS